VRHQGRKRKGSTCRKGPFILTREKRELTRGSSRIRKEKGGGGGTSEGVKRKGCEETGVRSSWEGENWEGEGKTRYEIVFRKFIRGQQAVASRSGGETGLGE